jgi:predicted transporter
MKKRPTSVTVIAWILLVTSGLFLLTSIMAINNPMAPKLMAKSPIPVPLQYVMLYLGLAISILCAIFMLRAANRARLLYIGWSVI